MGAFEQRFGLVRGEFEQKFSKNSNARGAAPGGGMLKLLFDWCIMIWLLGLICALNDSVYGKHSIMEKNMIGCRILGPALTCANVL